MNKWLIFIGITVLTILNITDIKAQMTSRAQRYFDRREYALAIPEYEKELKKKKFPRLELGRIEGQIGICYYYLNKPRDAANWFKKSISHGYHTAAIYRINGLALQKQEKYDEALLSFHECLKIDPGDEAAKRHIASCEYALAHPSPNNHISLRSSKINTNGSEYGISPVGNEIFFSRAPAKGNEIDPRTGLGFTEIYSTTIEKDDLVKPKREATFLRDYHNMGVFAFDPHTNYIYMTICDPKSGRCGIYRSKFNRKKWESPEPFLISENYDMAHPALAKEGSRLYFASNAPGGYGKTDIWYTDRLSENLWSEPVNAGHKVNTPGREEFPYIEKDQILYFASDGHTGFGGLDIFSAVIDGEELGEVTNIGRPFNSGADDFNLISHGDRGLLVSSRNLSRSDDIYIFNKKDIPSPTLPQEKKEEANAVLNEVKPEKETALKTVPEPDVEQKFIKAEKKPANDIAPEQTIPPSEGVATFYFDFNRFIPQREYREMYESVASLLKRSPKMKFVIEGHADEQGDAVFNQELSVKRAQYIYNRLVDRGVDPASLRIEGFGDRKPVIRNATTHEEYQLNRRVVIREDF